MGGDRSVMPLVGAADVAGVAASLLANPAPSAERAYFPVSEVLTARQMAESMGKALGRDIQYVEVSDEQWANGAKDYINDAHIVDHLAHLWPYFRTTKDVFRINYTIRALTGRTPQTLEQFVRANKRAFSR